MRNLISAVIRFVAVYKKAVVAGILAGVIVAAQYYSQPWLQIVAAIATPILVAVARNEDSWHH